MSPHSPDWLSLLCGLVFVGLGLAYLLAQMMDVHIPAIWTLTGLLVALGAAGLAGTAGLFQRGHDRDRGNGQGSG